MVPVSSSESCYHRPVTSEMIFNPSSMTPEAKYKGQMGFSSQDEYPGSSLAPGTMPYGQQPFMSAAPVAAEDNSDLYATACLKYRYGSPAAASVITHTGPTAGVLDALAHGAYPAPEAFTAVPYPAPSFGPPPTAHAAPPPPSARLSFPAAQRLSGRGKCKQKSPGMKSSALLASPAQSSCLAKLLSGSRPERTYGASACPHVHAQVCRFHPGAASGNPPERHTRALPLSTGKPALGFDPPSAEAKGPHSSPSHPVSSTHFHFSCFSY